MRSPHLRLPRLPRLRRPTYADVMATAAVVIALGTGTAYAAGLAPNSVKAKHIASNAVKPRHIADNAVRSADIATGQVGTRILADGSIATVDLQDGAVTGGKIANGTVAEADLANGAVGKARIKASAVDGSKIQDGSITGVDIAPDSISSTRLTTGVKNLLFNTGALAVNQTFSDFTVTNGSWPGGAPSSGAQMTASWTQPAGTIDMVTATARVVYPSGCTASAATARGFDVKITNADHRVISASSPVRTGGVNYNGNGFWADQAALPGVEFRPPIGSDLADDPAQFIDYVHLPLELSEMVTGSSSANRTVRFFFKRNSSSCSPEITGARVMVIRYGTS